MLQRIGQYGIIKNKDNQVDFAYQSITYNKDINLLTVQRGDKYGVVTMHGESIVPIQYKGIRNNGRIILARGYGEDTYYDEKGKQIENGLIGMKEIPEQNIYIITNQNNQYGLMDKAGKTLIECVYSYIDYAFDKYFIAFKEGKGLGVIDKENNTHVNFEYDVLSKVGDKNLLKAGKMGKNQDTTTIYSDKMKLITAVEDAKIAISNDYI